MLEGNVVGSVRCCRGEELGLSKEILSTKLLLLRSSCISCFSVIIH